MSLEFLPDNTWGYFSDPIKTMCSKKCAKPGISGGSLKLPIPTHKPHAACKRNMHNSTLKILTTNIFNIIQPLNRIFKPKIPFFLLFLTVWNRWLNSQHLNHCHPIDHPHHHPPHHPLHHPLHHFYCLLHFQFFRLPHLY